MSFSFLVALALGIGWNVILFLIAVFVNGGLLREKTSQGLMRRFQQEMEAEVEESALDVRPKPGQRYSDETASDRVRKRVRDASQTVSVEAPYAEGSVTVSTPDGDEARRCAVCLN